MIKPKYLRLIVLSIFVIFFIYMLIVFIDEYKAEKKNENFLKSFQSIKKEEVKVIKIFKIENVNYKEEKRLLKEIYSKNKIDDLLKIMSNINRTRLSHPLFIKKYLIKFITIENEEYNFIIKIEKDINNIVFIATNKIAKYESKELFNWLANNEIL